MTTRTPLAFGICRVQYGQANKNDILTCTYPVINWQEHKDTGIAMMRAAGLTETSKSESVVSITPDMARAMEQQLASLPTNSNTQVVKNLAARNDLSLFRLTVLFEDAAVQSLPAAYLKLGAMSARKVKPHKIDFSGIFGVLKNVAWSGNTAYDIAWLRENEIDLKMDGQYPAIDYVDKFPTYLRQVVPDDNTRILDGLKVRFGAYVSPGTVVMPGASYINFNAGTLGQTMIEGRVSSGVTIGEGSDVGGGASILGVLSGGNNTPISIGKNCLLGANSVTGIPLGDNCIVDAGTTILAGTHVTIPPQERENIINANPKHVFEYATRMQTLVVLKGSELAGLDALHFRQDSRTGMVTVIHSKRKIALNSALHDGPQKP